MEKFPAKRPLDKNQKYGRTGVDRDFFTPVPTGVDHERKEGKDYLLD